MARSLLTEGRAADVARMLEPLLPAESPTDAPVPEAGEATVRVLLARVGLLRYGDARRARTLLAPLTPLVEQETASPALRGDVALWLGWTHAWENTATHDAARAIHLLDRAYRLFEQTLDTAGRCWALLGQALAYGTLDEAGLLGQALDRAAPLEETLDDVQASLWFQALHARFDHYEGRYACARFHLDRLAERARHHDDPAALGRALAQQALVDLDLGRPPGTALDLARTALDHLAALPPGRPLLEAYLALLRTHLLRGDLEAADRVFARAKPATAEVSGAGVHLLLLQAHRALRGDDLDAAARHLDALGADLLPGRRPLLAAEAALLRSDLLARQGALDRAHDQARQAMVHAAEAGHDGRRAEALLRLARLSAEQGDLENAQTYLHQSEAYSDHFSALPLAAQRFETLAALARCEGRTADSEAYLAQARATYALLGDVVRTERLRREPALRRSTAAPPDNLGLALARSALSVELVAEAWLQAAERLLPGRWLGVYAWHRREGWTLLREHGPSPASLPLPAPDAESARHDPVFWMRLHARGEQAFFFGAHAAPDDPAWQAATDRLRPWLPVVALALDHANQQARRLTAALPNDVTHGGEPTLPLPGLVYASPAMRRLAGRIHRLRTSHSPILILGERGTGKELIARALHATSERREAPFRLLACADLTRERLERHLSGNADEPGGTLLLDEVADLPFDLQSVVLRFLEAGSTARPGDGSASATVRLLATTHRNLDALVRKGRFHESLYYHLRVVTLEVPPLRLRREDIPLLVRHFLRHLRPPGCPMISITPQALDALILYEWPGNVRQLRNEIERALLNVASEPAPLLDLEDFSASLRTALPTGTGPAGPPLLYNLDEAVAATERMLIEHALTETGGQVRAAADLLGLTRQGLYKKMRRLGIDVSRFQQRTEPAPLVPS